MAECIEKEVLYKKVAELEELARNRYLDTPSNSPACARFMEQLDERTRFKHLIADFPAADVAPVVRCRDCKHFNMKSMECENEAVSTDHEGGASYSLNFYLDDFCSYGERRKANG